jgi:uncharacterized BrkB/YihY/UPF0761 family membrane protein
LAIAASVLLSFYPFLTVMSAFFRNVLHWPQASQAIFLAVNDYLPGLGDFLARNSTSTAKVQLTSMILLLFTSNGVFEPMEVALNGVFGAPGNRSYLKNQLVSLGLIFLCGGLALLSLLLTAFNQSWIAQVAGGHNQVAYFFEVLFFKLAAIPISILVLFFVYWLLPNREIRPMRVAPIAIQVGLALEGVKYIVLLAWPLLRNKLHREYNVFEHSVSILLWSFVGSLVVLAGAHWAAERERELPPPPDQVS